MGTGRKSEGRRCENIKDSRCMCTGWAFYPRVGKWVTLRGFWCSGIFHLHQSPVNYLTKGKYRGMRLNAITSSWCNSIVCSAVSAGVISLCNHVTLYGLASPRLLHSLIDHIKTSHSFKHRYSNGRWVVLYALVSPQWSHAWFRGRVRTILLPATKLYPCVNKLGGSM